MGWTSIDLSPKLALACGGNVKYYKRVHHPIFIFIIIYPTRGNREHPGNFQLSFQLSVQVYSLLGKTEWERKDFSGECKEVGHIVRFPTRALGYHER